MESTETRYKFQPQTYFQLPYYHCVIFRFQWVRQENQRPHSNVIRTMEFGSEGENTQKTVAFLHTTQSFASLYIYVLLFFLLYRLTYIPLTPILVAFGYSLLDTQCSNTSEIKSPRSSVLASCYSFVPASSVPVSSCTHRILKRYIQKTQRDNKKKSKKTYIEIKKENDTNSELLLRQ